MDSPSGIHPTFLTAVSSSALVLFRLSRLGITNPLASCEISCAELCAERDVRGDASRNTARRMPAWLNRAARYPSALCLIIATSLKHSDDAQRRIPAITDASSASGPPPQTPATGRLSSPLSPSSLPVTRAPARDRPLHAAPRSHSAPPQPIDARYFRHRPITCPYLV